MKRALKERRLFVVSGPSGAGKTTLARMAVEFFGDIKFSISYTTRKPRPAEVDGVDYRFVTENVFSEMVRKGEFLEHARVHDKKYGTSKRDLKAFLSSGFDVLLDIDVQGGGQISKKAGVLAPHKAVYIFVLPPSMDVCRARLKKRGELKTEELEKRLKIAREEIKKAESYDYIIINEDIHRSFERLKSVITAERIKKDALIGGIKESFNL